ncbi:hypothetical protein EP7_003018 [Isosphaeraceae bacterium EP7]
MPPNPRKIIFPNPFYVVLLIASTLFTLTVFAYLIGPSVARQALEKGPGGGGPGPTSKAVTAWLDRNGPYLLAAEFALMLVSALLAMGFDHRFPEKPGGKAADQGS